VMRLSVLLLFLVSVHSRQERSEKVLDASTSVDTHKLPCSFGCGMPPIPASNIGSDFSAVSYCYHVDDGHKLFSHGSSILYFCFERDHLVFDMPRQIDCNGAEWTPIFSPNSGACRKPPAPPPGTPTVSLVAPPTAPLVPTNNK